MKVYASLAIVLGGTWLLWSGHFDEPFLLMLGAASVLVCLWMVHRMGIADQETAPTLFGLRPLWYLPYLIKEIVQSNLEVAQIVCRPKLKLQRNLLRVTPRQQTEVGKVVFANSITLTPGTVSISVEGEQIMVHALSYAGGEEDLSGEMNRRVQKMEGNPRSTDIDAADTP